MHLTSVSLCYRVMFLYIEPLSALVGAYFACFRQRAYLELTDAESSPLASVPTGTSVALSQLANLYLLFAFNEAFILRVTTDIKVWRTLLIGMLMADLGHLYSVASLGSKIYWDVFDWNAIQWGNVGFVYAGAITRSAFLLGIGLDKVRRLCVWLSRLCADGNSSMSRHS